MSPLRLHVVSSAFAILLTGWLAAPPAHAVQSQPASSRNLVITEIMFYPPAPSPEEQIAGFTDQDEFEFLELQNVSTNTLDLTSVAFTSGISFTFQGTLAPGQIALLVENTEAFELRYGPGLPVIGEYSGKLSNNGETLTLLDAQTNLITQIPYQSSSPWPVTVTGNPGGHALELIAPETVPNPSIPSQWRASFLRQGTPGHSADLDQDRLQDDWELFHFGSTAPLAEQDPDLDTLSNLQEQIRQTNPNNPDSDGDGLSDAVESNTGIFLNPQNTGTNPNNPDSDYDQLPDSVETNTGTYKSPSDTGTHPLRRDTDFDGYNDNIEVDFGSNPFDPTSFPVPPDILSFEVIPAEITVGESITLSWETREASSLFIQPEVGSVPSPAGALSFQPMNEDESLFVGTRSYLLTASNSYRTVSHSVTVTVHPDAPPIIHSLSAHPTRIGLGGAALLSWSVGGRVDRLELDQGVGEITGSTAIVHPNPQTNLLVSPGSVWRYLDDGSDHGTNWIQPDFDDATWSSGPAPLGYGNSYHATWINWGADQNQKHITTYFRLPFLLTNTSDILSATLSLKRDDGAQIFLNGTEILRDNLPDGPIDHLTLASQHAQDDGELFFNHFFEASLLKEGTNLLAVAIHQASPVSADIQFDLGLTIERRNVTSITYHLTAHNSAGATSHEVTIQIDPDILELVSYHDTWRFLDNTNTTMPGPAWMLAAYDDRFWPSGPGVLGQEYAGPAAPLIQTRLLIPDESGTLKAFLRTTFNFPLNPAVAHSLELTHLLDDGAVVYLNGQAIHKLAAEPGGDFALRIVGNAEFEGPFLLPASSLVPGENVLAVELLQPYYSTTDIVWGAQLRLLLPPPASPRLQILRSPGGLLLFWEEPGYELEQTSNLTHSWQPIQTPGQSFPVNPTEGPRFFRLRRSSDP